MDLASANRNNISNNIVSNTGSEGILIVTGHNNTFYNNTVTNTTLSGMGLRDIEDCPRMWKTMLGYYQKHCPHLVEEPPAITVTQPEDNLPFALIADRLLSVVFLFRGIKGFLSFPLCSF